MSKEYPKNTISEICENLDRKRVPISKKKRVKGSIPYYGASGIVDYVKDYLFDEDLLLVSEDGANLLARTYPIAFSVSGKIWVNNHAHVLRFSNIISQRFIEYYLNSIKLDDYVSGMAQPKLNQRALNSILVPFPPVPEQQKIVTLLDQAFAQINQAQANIERNIENTKELFQSKLNEIFSQRGEGWEEKKLMEVCDGFQYGSSSKSLKEGKVPVLRMGNIQNGRIDWKSLKYSSNEKEINKYLLKVEDVLFNRTNSPELVGKSAIYKGEQPSIFAGYLIRLRGKENILNNYYLNFFLNAPKTLEYGFSVMSSSVNQANINATKLKNYLIHFPKFELQKEIVRELKETQKLCNSVISIYSQKLHNLEELKKSLLEKAFQGELTQSANTSILSE